MHDQVADLAVARSNHHRSTARGRDSDHAEIARRAYALWEQRGRPPGRDVEIWLEAEAASFREAMRPTEETPAAPPVRDLPPEGGNAPNPHHAAGDDKIVPAVRMPARYGR